MMFSSGLVAGDHANDFWCDDAFGGGEPKGKMPPILLGTLLVAPPISLPPPVVPDKEHAGSARPAAALVAAHDS